MDRINFPSLSFSNTSNAYFSIAISELWSLILWFSIHRENFNNGSLFSSYPPPNSDSASLQQDSCRCNALPRILFLAWKAWDEKWRRHRLTRAILRCIGAQVDKLNFPLSLRNMLGAAAKYHMHLLLCVPGLRQQKRKEEKGKRSDFAIVPLAVFQLEMKHSNFQWNPTCSNVDQFRSIQCVSLTLSKVRPPREIQWRDYH